MHNLPHPSMPRTGLRQFGCHICHSQVWKYVIENMCAKFPCYNMTKFSANQSLVVHWLIFHVGLHFSRQCNCICVTKWLREQDLLWSQQETVSQSASRSARFTGNHLASVDITLTTWYYPSNGTLNNIQLLTNSSWWKDSALQISSFDVRYSPRK